MEAELLEAFKRYIDIDVDDEDKDEILEDILKYTEDYIYTSYGVAIFEREVVDILYPTYGPDVIYTNDGYISEVVSFSVNGEDIDVTKLSASKNKIRILDGEAILYYTNTVEVNYKVGYTVFSDIPKSLVNALFIISKKIWNDSVKDTDTLSSVSIGIKETIHVIEDIPLVAKQSLEAHRMYKL